MALPAWRVHVTEQNLSWQIRDEQIKMAQTLYGAFRAFQDEGFTEEQAFALVDSIVRSVNGGTD